jgi:hypothetical protein
MTNTTTRAQRPGPRRYRGGCPCGAVLWEVQLDLADNDQGSSTVWQRSVPSPLFKLLRGDDGLSGYQFFANSAHHFFCARCSSHAFSHQVEPRAVTSGQRELEHDPDLYTIDLRSLHVDARRCAVGEPAGEPAVAWLDRELTLTRPRPPVS